MDDVLKWLLIALGVIVIAGLVLVVLVVALFVPVSRNTEPAGIGPTISFEVVEPATPTTAGTLDATQVRPTPPPPENIAASPGMDAASNALSPREGFQLYEDSHTGLWLEIPADWTLGSSVPGQSAVFQSFPTDKYVGGEPLAPGDTKCDLSVYPPGDSVAGIVAQVKQDTTASAVALGSVMLEGGEIGTLLKMEGFGGPSRLLLTAINDQVVGFGCFGELTPFDQIAPSLRVRE